MNDNEITPPDLENSDDSINEERTCKICWEDIEVGTHAELHCCKKKVYCNNCISSWLLNKQTCPFCMEKYDVNFFDSSRTLVSFDRTRGTELLDMIRIRDDIIMNNENNPHTNILLGEAESVEDSSQDLNPFTPYQNRLHFMDITRRICGLILILIVMIFALIPIVIYMIKSHQKPSE